MRAFACAFALMVSLPVASAEVGGAARLWLGGGMDTNPRRDYVSNDVVTPIDAVLQGIGNLEGFVEGERLRAGGVYDIGGRKFITVPTEDTVVQSLFLDGSVYLGRGFSLGVAGRGRDRRGAERDYTDLGGDLVLNFQPDRSLDVRVRGGVHRFVFWDRFTYSFGAGEGGLSARYRFDKRHSVALSGDLSLRQYNNVTNANPNLPDAPPPQPRADTFVSVGAAYTFRGPVNVTASYSFVDSASNSFGESYRQHRIGLLFGVALPWRLTFLLNATLRLMQYPDGVYLSPDLLVLEDDENVSSGSLKLVRSIGDHFEIDLRYSVFYGRLDSFSSMPLDMADQRVALIYQRHVVTLGAAVRF